MTKALEAGIYISITLDAFDGNAPRTTLDADLLPSIRTELERHGFICHEMKNDRPLLAVEATSGPRHIVHAAIRNILKDQSDQLVIGEWNVAKRTDA